MAAPPAGAAGPALESVEVEAWVRAGEPASISMRYHLRPAGASSVDFGSMRFGAAGAVDVRAFLDGREIVFRSRPAAAGRVDGRVELPFAARRAERIALRLVYEVQPATGGLDRPTPVLLPLLVAVWPPSETLPETFQATVHLPASLFVRSSFPSTIEPSETAGAATGTRSHRLVLPVVPALVRLEVASGAPPLLTLERAVDLVAVATLLSLCILGWKRLRASLA